MEKIKFELKIPHNSSGLMQNESIDKVMSKDVSNISLKPEKKFENQFLKNKIKRAKEEDEKENSKKLMLKNQIEFYFSDENLLHDKFLQKFLIRDKDKGVPLTIIDNFNKVKEILLDVKDLPKRINYIKNAIESSNILKLNKKTNKIKRQNDFKLDKIDYNKIDERSVYVENLPNNINHDLLNIIFSRCGKVVHVSIPKFSDNKKPKGFGFIIYEKKEDAKRALSELNNKVPKELLNWSNNQPLRELVIFSKKHWLEKKEEYKKLKNELQNENQDLFISCFKQSNSSVNQIKEGTLIFLKDLPEKITKNELKILISHFVEPSYIDLNHNKNECIVRFSHPILADSFINLFKGCEENNFKNQNIKVEKLEGEEEKQYIQKIEKLQAEFAKNKKRNSKN